MGPKGIFATLGTWRATFRSRLEDRSGLALIATLLVVALVAVLTTVAITGAMSALRTSGSDYQDTRVFYAAEAGGEATLAQLKIALADGYLSDDELTNMHPPSLQAIDFDSFAVQKMGEATVETVTDGPYAGLYALTQNVDIYSRAANSKGDMAAVILRTKAQAIPIFQFGVFFEQDLEATNGPPMEFVGRVHSNGNIYLSSDNAWYRDLITTPNKIFHDRKDFHSVKNGVFVNDAGGNEVMLNFDSRTHAGAEAFKAESCASVDCRVMTDAFEVDSLRLPLPDGVPPYELILPRQSDDGDAEQSVKFAWNADLYLKVDLVNLQTRSDICGKPAVLPPDVTNSSNISVTGTGYVCPGETVKFIASHPALVCSDFDARALLTIDDDVKVFSGPMNGCEFDVTLPNGVARDFKIKIELKKDDYVELNEDGKADVVWLKESIDANCSKDLDTATMPWPTITIERSSGKQSPPQKEMCQIFQWNWSDYYDGREAELKDVMNLDITQLVAWSAGVSDRAAEVVFVEFIVPADVGNYKPVTRDLMPDASLDPALRVINGSSLPNPMTISTEWPIYVLGNYNSVNKQPSALVGDGITLLSNAWVDDNNRPDQTILDSCNGMVNKDNPCKQYTDWALTWAKKNSAETWVNAAILAGHWPTPCDHEESTCAADGTSAYYSDWYGGGLENFPRFLEHWFDAGGNQMTLHYKGALVSPFTSQKTTGTWNGVYYTPPQRDWSFDTDFQDPRLLPPGTPNVGYVIRTAMREAY